MCLLKRNITTKTARVSYNTCCIVVHYVIYAVAISFDKFRSLHPALSEVDDIDDDDIDSGDNEEITQHSPNTSGGGSSKKRRAKRSTETTPTKHDAYVCGRRNVRNMEKVIY